MMMPQICFLCGSDNATNKEEVSQMKEKDVYKIGVWNIAFSWDLCEISAPHMRTLQVNLSMKAVYFIARVTEYGE